MESGSWAGRAVLAVGLVALLLVGGAGNAPAAAGQRMLRIACDENSNLVTVEPFLLWGGVTRPGQEGPADRGKAAGQTIGIDSYYRIDDLETFAISHDCAMTLRNVTVTGEGGEIRITETIGSQVATFSLGMSDAAFGQAWPQRASWHPVAGKPTFWLESRAPGQWFECWTVAQSDDTLCEAIGLYPPNTEIFTMAPMQSEPMPIEPMGWLSSTAGPAEAAPRERPLLGDHPGPGGPVLN